MAEEQQVEKYQQLLRATPIGELVWHKRVLVCADETTTVEQALDVMAKENILSLPIIKGSVLGMMKSKMDSTESKPSEDRVQYLGMVNIYDIMSYVAFGVSPNDGITLENIQQFAYDKYATVPVAYLLGISDESISGDSGLWSYLPETRVWDVLEPMSKGIHRVLVQFDGPRKDSIPSYRLLAQSDIVKFLCQNSDLLGDMPKRPINQLGLVHDPASEKFKVVTVPTSSTAVHAFRIMYQKNVLAAAIVNENNVMVAAISASDLRGVHKGNLSALLLPVLEFLKQGPSGQVRFPVTCSPADSLISVMLKATLNHVHRVFVVNEHNNPVGVVTYSDMLNKFSPFDFTQ